MHTPEDILKDAISLPPSDKAYLIDKLLKSLDKPDNEIDKLWAEESEKRIEAYEKGELKADSIEVVLNKYKHL